MMTLFVEYRQCIKYWRKDTCQKTSIYDKIWPCDSDAMSLDTDQETYGQKDVKYLVEVWGREENKNRNEKEVCYRF